jgi:hypothetical protein
MEALCSSETSVETQRTTRRHIPEDDTLEESYQIADRITVLDDYFLVSSVYSAIMTEALRSFETTVNIYQTRRRSTPENLLFIVTTVID